MQRSEMLKLYNKNRNRLRYDNSTFLYKYGDFFK